MHMCNYSHTFDSGKLHLARHFVAAVTKYKISKCFFSQAGNFWQYASVESECR